VQKEFVEITRYGWDGLRTEAAARAIRRDRRE
jgi:hypothetical protein